MKRLKHQVCPDCLCIEGELHEYGCELEECPFCGSPVIQCGCDLTYLGLIDRGLYTEETNYIEPEAFNNGLSANQQSIWINALNKKGRAPYIYYPLVCERCGKLWPDFFMVPDEEWNHYISIEARGKILCRECYRYIKWAIDKETKSASERETPMRQIISPSHLLWKPFVKSLRGIEGCNCQLIDGKLEWNCSGDFHYSKGILDKIPKVDIQATLNYFRRYGASCDCEILFKIDRFDNDYRDYSHKESNS